MWHAMQLPSKPTDYTANEHMLRPALLLASALQHVFQIHILTAAGTVFAAPLHAMSLWDLASSTHLDMELKRLVVMLASRVSDSVSDCPWQYTTMPSGSLTSHISAFGNRRILSLSVSISASLSVASFPSAFSCAVNIRIIASATALTWALVAVALPLDEGLHGHCPLNLKALCLDPARPEASPAFATQAGLPGHLGGSILPREDLVPSHG